MGDERDTSSVHSLHNFINHNSLLQLKKVSNSIPISLTFQSEEVSVCFKQRIKEIP